MAIAPVDPNLLLDQIGAADGVRPGDKKDPAALRKVCEDFEAIFVRTLFKGMRASLPKDGLFGNDNATAIYQDLEDFQVARQLSHSQGLGIADMLYRQLSQKEGK